MNSIEIVSKLVNECDTVSGLLWKLVSCSPDSKYYPKVPDGVTIDVVYGSGGSEGEGEEVERVVSVTMNGETQYVQILGFYTSDDGTEWDSPEDWNIVVPYQYTETRYRSPE